MVKSCLRMALMLIVAFTLAVVVVMIAPYDDQLLHHYMIEPELCGGKCVLGVRAGVTALGTALAHLQTHLWVENLDLTAPGTGYGQIRWQWSGQQPDFIDNSHLGRITFYWDREDNPDLELLDVKVETITIYTRLRMPVLQDRLGLPDSGAALIRLDGSLGYAAAYAVQGSTISLSTSMPCPVNLMSYWNTATKITMSIGQGTSEYVPPTAMVKIC